MPFQEKSAIAMTGTLVIVYGAYFALIGRWLATAAVDEVIYQPVMIAAVIPLAILATISHVLLALINPKEANMSDERDKLVALRSERPGAYILAVGAFAGIVLAMVEAPHIYIANALLLAWVLAEISDNALKVVFYRRGA